MNPKVLLVVVVVLAILFFAGVGVGIGQDDGKAADLSPNWVEGLQNLVGGGQRLEAEDLHPTTPATCRQQFEQGTFVLANGGMCRLVVRESSAAVRSLSLQLTQGSSVVIELVQNEDDGLEFDRTLDASRPSINVHFMEEGGQVTALCPPLGSACRVDLE